MGTVQHEGMIITSWNEKHLKEAREKALSLIDPINVSEIIGDGINGYRSFFISPSGSKAWWQPWEEHRAGLNKMIKYLSSEEVFANFALVSFGEIYVKTISDQDEDEFLKEEE